MAMIYLRESFNLYSNILFRNASKSDAWYIQDCIYWLQNESKNQWMIDFDDDAGFNSDAHLILILLLINCIDADFGCIDLLHLNFLQKLFHLSFFVK